jgi:hypothetical protein
MGPQRALGHCAVLFSRSLDEKYMIDQFMDERDSRLCGSGFNSFFSSSNNFSWRSIVVPELSELEPCMEATQQRKIKGERASIDESLTSLMVSLSPFINEYAMQ